MRNISEINLFFSCSISYRADFKSGLKVLHDVAFVFQLTVQRSKHGAMLHIEVFQKIEWLLRTLNGGVT